MKEIFGNYGLVNRTKINRIDETAISQGLGYVEMASFDDAMRAIKYLDGSQIDGMIIMQVQL